MDFIVKASANDGPVMSGSPGGKKRLFSLFSSCPKIINSCS